MEKFELNEGQGSLWHEKDVKVVRKGKIKIEGTDRYASILEYTNPNTNEKKYELSISGGLLHLVAQEDKQNDKSPDMYGNITFNNTTYKAAFWRNVRDTGQEWTGVQLQVREDEEEGETKQNDEGSRAPF